MMRIASLLMLAMLTTSCAHVAELKTPSQIAKDEQKKQANEERAAQRAAKRKAKDAARAAEENVEVSLPESTQ